MHADTLLAREWPDPRTTAPHTLPLYATSSFAFDNMEQGIAIFQDIRSGHVYSRYANPTVDAVAKKIAALEGHGLDLNPEPVMTASGMAAIATLLLGVLRQGDKVLTQGNLYGGTTELFTAILQKFGIEPVFTNLSNLHELESVLHQDRRIRMLYCETPANPSLACVDIKALSQLIHQFGGWCAVDNTFCTPLLQQPFALGADFVVHSTTKYLNGHGNSTAGIVLGRDEDLMRQHVWRAMKLVGTNCSPFEAWVTHHGMKTLALRMERHCANALLLARFLEQHPAVERVNYPGLESHPDHQLASRQMRSFGGMLSFELRGGQDAGIRFMNATQLGTLAPTLGDVDTLVLHPASSSHLAVPREVRLANGITDGLVRVSVGIEHGPDLVTDFENALS